MKSNKNILAAIIGNALEYYDVSLFLFFQVAIRLHFFPDTSRFASTMLSLSALAAGFITRPVGAAIFGHLGDKYGRKKALFLAILLVTIPTTVIGILPGYDTLGVLAPIILFICRLCQGLCTGGEYTGASVFIYEHAHPQRRGLITSILPVSGLLGAILAIIIGLIVSSDDMPEWAWRLPFLLGGLFGVLGLLLRSQIEETEAFHDIENHHAVEKLPLVASFQHEPRNFMASFLGSSVLLAPFYMSFGYILQNATTISNNSSQSLTLKIQLFLMLTMSAMLPFFGWLSDFIGRKRLMIASCLGLIVFSFPIVACSLNTTSFDAFLLSQICLFFITAGFIAPSAVFFTSLFPAKNRYSGMGVASTLGEAIFGGTTPLIAASLVYFSNSNLAPAFYLILCGCIGLLGVHMAIERDPQQLLKS